MATVGITAQSVGGGGNEVYSPIPDMSVAITSSGTTQQTAAFPAGRFLRIKVTGNNVWINIGPSPVAAAGTGYLVTDGESFDCGPIGSADKVAVIDAA